MKNQIRCEIVKDLLPLYQDGVVNKVTADTITQHLSGCENCKEEFESLQQDFLQIKDSNEVKSKFEIWKRGLKKKQVMRTIIVAILSCVAIIILGYVMLNEPLVPVSDDQFDIKAAYRIETEEGSKLFIVYTKPAYWSETSCNPQVVKEGKKTILHMNLKHPVLSRKDEINIEEADADCIAIDEDVTEISFSGKIIWSEKKNGSDEIPQYVYDYEQLGEHNWVFIIDLENDFVGFDYEDRNYEVHWSYDGKVIYEGYYEGANPKYFEGHIIKKERNYLVVVPLKRYWLSEGYDVLRIPVDTQSENASLNDFAEGNKIGVYFYNLVSESEPYTISEVKEIIKIDEE